ncbi:MAG TPA: MFS transporter [Stellaceae bacterium]|nr:MFS transporter [Stellaceae bacterium]
MSPVVPSVESRRSWIAAAAALGVMSVAFGAPYIVVVALKDIAADLGGGARAVPAACYALAWLGTAVGGVAMGHAAERFGLRATAIFGGAMIALGLLVASRGTPVALYLSHGVLIGMLGLGSINAPSYVYVSRWFDRHRGTALALISSGSYVAGAIWPLLFEQAIVALGWRHTMMLAAPVELLLVLTLAWFFLDPPPRPELAPAFAAARGRADRRVLGLNANLVLGLIAVASFLCCVPMAMPQGHLIAFCSDLGIRPEIGAAMLAVLLGTGFVSRQFWGWISDRIGGIKTVLASSACQALAMAALLMTQDEAGLFAVSAFFGFGFSGIVPAYVLAIREFFPAEEASWRVPVMMLCSGSGMAAGGWLAGVLYDHYGFYGAAFAAGLFANVLNLALVGFLAARSWRVPGPRGRAQFPSVTGREISTTL